MIKEGSNHFILSVSLDFAPPLTRRKSFIQDPPSPVGEWQSWVLPEREWQACSLHYLVTKGNYVEHSLRTQNQMEKILKIIL